MLLGTAERIVEVVPSANVAENPEIRFEIEPALLFATHRRAREAGLQLLGPYHSHPGGRLEPSPRDAADAQISQLWIIASPAELRCWRYAGEGVFTPVDLQILA